MIGPDYDRPIKNREAGEVVIGDLILMQEGMGDGSDTWLMTKEGEGMGMSDETWKKFCSLVEQFYKDNF